MRADPRYVIACAASGDQFEGDEIASDVLFALADEGLHVCGEGQAVIGGSVVDLAQSTLYMVDTSLVEKSHPVEELRGKVLFGLACDRSVLPLRMTETVLFVPPRSQS